MSKCTQCEVPTVNVQRVIMFHDITIIIVHRSAPKLSTTRTQLFHEMNMKNKFITPCMHAQQRGKVISLSVGHSVYLSAPNEHFERNRLKRLHTCTSPTRSYFLEPRKADFLRLETTVLPRIKATLQICDTLDL